MLSTAQVPTLWDPEELFSHLALWAGVPVLLVAIVVGLLGLYQSAKSWIELTRSTVDKGKVARGKMQAMTSMRQRASARLAVFSVLAVAFSYVLAVIVNAFIQLAEEDPNVLVTSKVVESAVVATQWSPAAVWTVVVGVAGIGLLGVACIADLTRLRGFVSFLGGTACVVAWVMGVLLSFNVILEFILLFVHKAGPPMPFVVTEAVTAVLLVALGLLLPRIRRASDAAFDFR